MKALVVDRPGEARIIDGERALAKEAEALLQGPPHRVLRHGPQHVPRAATRLSRYPRILGHEVAATIESVPANDLGLRPGMDVTLSPYTSCGICSSCRQGRVNACRFNQTLGVQRDGAMQEFLNMPLEKLYAAPLSLEELCLVEPLTVGCHAVARGQVTRRRYCRRSTVAAASASVQSARLRSAVRPSVAIDLDDDKLEIARKAGAKHLFTPARRCARAVAGDHRRRRTCRDHRGHRPS